MNDAYAHAMQVQKCNLTLWLLQALPHHVNATGREATSPTAIGYWRHSRTRSCAGMQEHVVRVVKILEGLTLCEPVKYKILE
jgi:hypothetical protein